MPSLEQMFAGFAEGFIQFFIDVMSFLSFAIIAIVFFVVIVFQVHGYFSRRKVLRVMRENNVDCNFNQLVQKTGMDEDDLKEIVADLKRDGRIKEVENS